MFSVPKIAFPTKETIEEGVDDDDADKKISWSKQKPIFLGPKPKTKSKAFEKNFARRRQCRKIRRRRNRSGRIRRLNVSGSIGPRSLGRSWTCPSRRSWPPRSRRKFESEITVAAVWPVLWSVNDCELQR